MEWAHGSTISMELSKVLSAGSLGKIHSHGKTQKPERYLYKLFFFKRTVCLTSEGWMGSMMKGRRLQIEKAENYSQTSNKIGDWAVLC